MCEKKLDKIDRGIFEKILRMNSIFSIFIYEIFNPELIFLRTHAMNL